MALIWYSVAVLLPWSTQVFRNIALLWRPGASLSLLLFIFIYFSFSRLVCPCPPSSCVARSPPLSVLPSFSPPPSFTASKSLGKSEWDQTQRFCLLLTVCPYPPRACVRASPPFLAVAASLPRPWSTASISLEQSEFVYTRTHRETDKARDQEHCIGIMAFSVFQEILFSFLCNWMSFQRNPILEAWGNPILRE